MENPFLCPPGACIGVILVVMSLLIAAPAAAMQKTDVITLDNGDIITGEIKNVGQGQLQLSTTAMGTVYVKWIHIASVQTDKILEVVVQTGERFYGSLQPGADPENLNVVSGETSVPVPRQEIAAMVPIGASFWKKLDGDVNLSFDFTQSSDQLDYSLNFNSTYTTRMNRVRVNATSSIKRVEGETTTNQHQLAGAWQRETRWNRWFAIVLGGVEQSLALDLDFRGTAGGGMGRYFKETSRYRLSAFGAGLFVQENYSESPANRNLDVSIGTTLDVFIYGAHDISLTTGFQVIPSVTDSGRVRLALNSQLSYELFHNLTLGFQVYEQYDSRPPQEGALTNDLQVSTSFGYKW